MNRKRGRPKKLVDPVATNLQLPASLMAALNEWVADLQRSVPGGEAITRADLIRDILKRAVEQRVAGGC